MHACVEQPLEIDGDEDDEEDEARVMHARRQALVALDPNNRDSWKAEFKSLKEYSLKKTSLEKQRQELELQPHPDSTNVRETHQRLEVLEEPLDTIPDKTFVAADNETPPTSVQKEYSCDQDGNSVFSTPKSSIKRLEEEDLPEISISLATPSPPSSLKNHRRESSHTDANPSLLSTTYTPSPLSLSIVDPLDEPLPEISPEKARAKERRTTVIYKSLFQRITSPAPRASCKIELGVGVESDTMDHIGAEIADDTAASQPATSLSSPSCTWSLNRNTFGAFSKQIGNHDQPPQQHNQHQQQSSKHKHRRDQQGHGSSLFRKQRTNRHAHDPWDSCDDMLIQATDDEGDSETHYTGGGQSSLKGRVGVKLTGVDAAAGRHQSSPVSELENGAHIEDWIVHPRTAAIKGTFHKVYEAVPVPSKDQRQVWLGSEYTTISLASPPTRASTSQTTSDDVSLQRPESTDASFDRLRKGASSLLSGWRTATSPHDSNCQEIKGTVQNDNSQMRRMLNGQATENYPHLQQSDTTNRRSNFINFGPRMPTTTSPPMITLSSFPSFRDLISSAAGLTRSATFSEHGTYASFSPTTHLSRAQTTTYTRHSMNDEHLVGSASGSRMTFSPASRRKVACVMLPNMIIPNNSPDEPFLSSTAEITEDLTASASSSLTVITSGLHESHTDLQDANSEVTDSSVPISRVGSFPSRSFTFQRLVSKRHSLLKVPGLAKTGSSTKQNHSTTSAAAVTMSSVHHASPSGEEQGRSSLLTSSSDSLAGPLTGDDYIGQFERERAIARGTPAPSDPSSASSSSATLTNNIEEQSDDLKKHRPEMRSRHRCERQSATIHNLRRSFLQTVRRERESGLDMSDKLMHLPELSRFEGMCSCRGVINIASMVLILCGLVLLILGYPIATSLSKDKVEAQNAAARTPVNTVTTVAAAASERNQFQLSDSSASTANVVVRDLVTSAEKRTAVARHVRELTVVFSDEFNRHGRMIV
ncbi:hypothetical protein BGX28_004079 [Mortierella sp. GBA30]|nr:hypothetical protein BGX28_004079 [Mortierella sp. GBA30]